MSQKSVAAILIKAARRTDRHDEAHRRFMLLCECASSDAVSRVLQGVIIRVCDTRIVEKSNALIVTKPEEETANPMIEAVRWYPVPSKRPAGRHEATTASTSRGWKRSASRRRN